MSERTRMEVWDQIRASELLGSDIVPLPIETAKLLLECARLINEGAVRELRKRGITGDLHTFNTGYHLSDQDLRDGCERIYRKL